MNNIPSEKRLDLTSINHSSNGQQIESTHSSIKNPSNANSVNRGTKSTRFQKFKGFVSKHKLVTTLAVITTLTLIATGIGAIITGSAFLAGLAVLSIRFSLAAYIWLGICLYCDGR